MRKLTPAQRKALEAVKERQVYLKQSHNNTSKPAIYGATGRVIEHLLEAGLIRAGIEVKTTDITSYFELTDEGRELLGGRRMYAARLDKIKNLAEAASQIPGPWRGISYSAHNESEAAFSKAASPENILDMIGEIQWLKDSLASISKERDCQVRT